jgi:hypothetical protein
MTIEIINMNHPYQHQEGDVVCDRSSKFGNPFIMYSQMMRDVVCDNYEDYLEEIIKPGNQAMVRNVLRAGGLNSTQVETWMIRTGGFLDLGELKNARRLCCHCKPRRCHCDTLKKKLEALQEPVLGVDKR